MFLEKPKILFIIFLALCASLMTIKCVPADSFSLAAGVVRPEAQGSKLWWTANYRFSIKDNVAIEPEAGFWNQSFFIPFCVKAASVCSTHQFKRDITAGANIVYEIPAHRFGLSFGAGVLAHFLKRSTKLRPL